MLIQVVFTDEEKDRIDQAIDREGLVKTRTAFARMAIMRAVKEAEEREAINDRR